MTRPASVLTRLGATGGRTLRQNGARRRAGGLLLILAAMVACGGDDGANDDQSITVFAAASLTDVFTEIGADFEATQPGTSVDFSFGPSSGLVTQVIEGAPADVIATASTATMDQLVAADAVDGAPDPFATNALEIAVPPGNPGRVEGLADLADDELIVALCAEEVPCGALARDAFRGVGVAPSPDSNEQDVRAVLTKVEAGEVDAGVVYRTDVVAAGDTVEGVEVPEAGDVVTTYPIAVGPDSDHVSAARSFIGFVLGEEGQALLADAGFGPP